MTSHETRCVFRNTNGPGTRLWSDRGRMWHIDSSHKEKIDHAIVYHVPGDPPEGPTCMYLRTASMERIEISIIWKTINK